MAIKFLNTVAVDTDVLYVDAANDRVGIGTTNPSQKLTVEGNIELGTGGYIYGNTTTSYLRLNTAVGSLLGYSNAYIGLGPSFVYNIGGSEKFRISSANGNVGIGTTSPSTSLHVKSTSAGSGYMTIENTVHYSKLDLKSTTYTGSIIMDGTGGYISGGGLILDSGTNIRTQFLQGGTAKMIINNGNVGIGTTNPGNKLQVTGGSIGIDSEYAIRDNRNNTILQQSASTLTSNRALLLGNATYSDIVVPNGNVGIGTTSPSYKLQVNGTIAPEGNEVNNLGTSTNRFNQFFTKLIYDINNGRGLTNQILTSTGSGGIAWANASTVIGGPYLPLAGGTMTGALKLNDNVVARFGTGNDLTIYHTGTTTLFDNNVGDVIFRQFADNKDIIFQSDNGSGGVATYFSLDGSIGYNKFSKDALFTDGVRATFGSNVDLQIYHDGSNSYISDQGTGSLKILATNFDLANSAANASMIRAIDGAQVELYYGGAKKFETTSTGVDVTGTARMDTGITEGIHYIGAGVEHWGDGGTGMSFPANDTLSLRTASSDRLYITSNGNVGIGTTSPGDKLQVSGGAIRLDDFYQLRWGGTGTGVYGHSSQGLNFYTNSGSTRLKISNNGNVGIGTTSPNRQLTVSDASTNAGFGAHAGPIIALSQTDTTVNNQATLLFQSGNGAVAEITSRITNHSSYYGDLLFGTRSAGGYTAKMAILSTGNVGIGTTSPTSLLHVKNSTYGTALASFETSGRPLTIGAQSTYVYMGYGNREQLKIAGTAGNGRIIVGTTLTDDGTNTLQVGGTGYFSENVGIGTTTPLELLHLESTEPLIRFDDTNSGLHYIVGQNGDGFSFTTNNSTYGKYTFDANVGIGTTSPSTPLHFGKSVYGDPSSENFFRIKFNDVGGVNNDVGIGQPNASSIGWNITPSADGVFEWNAGTAGRVMNLTNAGVLTLDNYDSTNNTGTPTYLLGTDASGNIVKTNTVPGSAAGPYLPLAGGTMTGNAKFNDTVQLQFGTGNDMRIFHTPGSSYIENLTGDLYIKTANVLRLNTSSNESMINASPNGPVQLYYDNSRKLATTSAGISVTGNGIFTGNVGIGTTSPSEKLSIYDSSTSTGYVASFGNTSNLELLIGTTTGAYLNIQGSTISSGATYNFSLQADGGNVGIGTTSPTTKLNVSGNIAVSSGNYLSFIDSNLSYNNIGRNTSVGGIQITTGASATMNLLDNGNVGIGITSPNAKLEVQGPYIVSASPVVVKKAKLLDLSLSTSSYYGGFAEFWMGRYADVANHAKSILTISLNDGLYGSNNNADTDVMTLRGDGNVGIGTTSPSSRLEIVGPYQQTPLKVLRHADYGNVITVGRYTVSETANIGYPADATLNLSTNGSERMRILANGTILIGSTIDFSNGNADDLQIGNTTGSHGLSIMSQNNAVGSIYFGDNDNNDAGVINYEHGLNQLRFVTNRTQKMVITSAGDVGIGTTSPSEKLQVNGRFYIEHQGSDWNETTPGQGIGSIHLDPAGSGTAHTGNAITFGSSDHSNGSVADAGIYTRSDGSYGTKMYLATTDSYAAGSRTRMMIDSNGNVGIGTTSPNQKLHVIGNAKVSGVLYSSILSNDNGVSQKFRSSAGSDLMTILEGGNVGIGTITPTEKLSVFGSLLATSSQGALDNGYFAKIESGYSANPLIISSRLGVLMQAEDYGNSLSLHAGSTERVRIRHDGNVGIGTTSPGEKLTVIGKALLNNGSSLYVDSAATQTVFANIANIPMRFQTNSANRLTIGGSGAIQFNNYDSTNNTGTPTYILGTDASGNVVKTQQVPGVSAAASLYELIPNGAFTTTYSFTSVAGVYSEVMEGNDVITSSGTYSVQVYVHDPAAGGTQYYEFYSGVMSWFATGTNDAGGGAVSEIALHRAGHAGNQGMIYLRTRETNNAETNKLKLEIMCNRTYTSASNVVFKFVRLI